MKHSNQTQLSLHSISSVIDNFISFSLNTGNDIGDAGATILSEALKSNSSLNKLFVDSTSCCFISFSLGAENNISDRGVFSLSEALKSNTSLRTLYLSSNKLVSSFHSHPIQIMRLVMQEQSNYLKHSHQTQPSLFSISAVTILLFISFSLNTANKIGDDGAIKLCESLKSNTTLSSLNLSSNHFVASFHSHSIQQI
jgi:hypothetical protein